VMNALSWQIMKRMRYQPWVGLPNILLEDFAVPELIQEAATPRTIAAAGLAWLDDPAACARLAGRFDGLHRLLRRDTAHAATRVIEGVLGH
jgi:lipid-A-disaccharide synthase